MKCSFCRNEPAENEHEYEGDFVFVMCDDCNTRYLKNKQLGPKFLICKCDPDNPRELDLSMGKEEIETVKKQMKTVPEAVTKNLEDQYVKGSREINELNIKNDKKILAAVDLDKKDETYKQKKRKKLFDTSGKLFSV